MPKPTVSADPFKRYKTRYRGISYRERADGSRAYAVYHAGRYVPAGATEAEALALQAEHRRQKARGQRVIVPSKTTFAELAEAWWQDAAPRLRESTRRGYRRSLDRILLPRFGSWRIAAIDADAISVLIRELEKAEKAPSTISEALKPLRRIMRRATRRGLIGTDPFSLLEAEDRPSKVEAPEPHVWSDDEIEALLAQAKPGFAGIIWFAVKTGLRIGELLGLQWRDFDREARVLAVERLWTRFGEYAPPKTAAGKRRIPLSEELVSFLVALRLRSRFSQDDQPVFVSRSGRPLDHSNVSGRGFADAAKRAGIEGVSFHHLRHAAASRMIARGLNHVTVASVLGHSDPSVTLKVYAHLWDRETTDDAIRAAL